MDFWNIGISMGLRKHVFGVAYGCHDRGNEENNAPHIVKEKLLGIKMLAVPPRHRVV